MKIDMELIEASRLVADRIGSTQKEAMLAMPETGLVSVEGFARVLLRTTLLRDAVCVVASLADSEGAQIGLTDKGRAIRAHLVGDRHRVRAASILNDGDGLTADARLLAMFAMSWTPDRLNQTGDEAQQTMDRVAAAATRILTHTGDLSIG